MSVLDITSDGNVNLENSQHDDEALIQTERQPDNTEPESIQHEEAMSPHTEGKPKK